MRAVNLIPKDERRGARLPGRVGISPAYAVLGVLALVLALVVIYVLSANTVADRKAELATVRSQINAQQAEVARLRTYVQFEQLAQRRLQTVREIASARFDWYRALSELSKVVPANTSLESLSGTVAPGASAGNAGAAGGSSLRAQEPVPAFELIGCTETQDDVARLMSRLRLINGVTRVTLGSSQKTGPGASAPSVGAGGGGGCGANAPTFDLVVFFQPLPGAGPTGVTAVSSQPTGAGGAR